MSIKSRIAAALATILIMSVAPAAVATADSGTIETQATTADGSKTCKKGKDVRLKVTYKRGLIGGKLIYNVSRTSEKAVNLPTGAGEPKGEDVTLEISTFQQSSAFYASVPKGKEGAVSIDAVCV